SVPVPMANKPSPSATFRTPLLSVSAMLPVASPPALNTAVVDKCEAPPVHWTYRPSGIDVAPAEPSPARVHARPVEDASLASVSGDASPCVAAVPVLPASSASDSPVTRAPPPSPPALTPLTSPPQATMVPERTRASTVTERQARMGGPGAMPRPLPARRECAGSCGTPRAPCANPGCPAMGLGPPPRELLPQRRAPSPRDPSADPGPRRAPCRGEHRRSPSARRPPSRVSKGHVRQPGAREFLADP